MNKFKKSIGIFVLISALFLTACEYDYKYDHLTTEKADLDLTTIDDVNDLYFESIKISNNFQQLYGKTIYAIGNIFYEYNDLLDKDVPYIVFFDGDDCSSQAIELRFENESEERITTDGSLIEIKGMFDFYESKDKIAHYILVDDVEVLAIYEETKEVVEE